ncbi:MAG: replication protein P [Porticoccaceae bacterium]
MQHSKHPVEQAVRDIATSSKNSPTAAGQAKSAPPHANPGSHPELPGSHPELIDAINQVFALFRINYHNQFYAAFNDTVLLDQAKRLWLETLANFGPAAIMAAAREIIEQHDYLPTLKKMLDACDHQLINLGLPMAKDAYIEACNTPSPKNVQDWSHPAVYFAGREVGWHRLANQSEKASWPEFQSCYRNICQRVLSGETLVVERPPALESPAQKDLNQQEKQEEMKALRQELGF